MPNAFPSPNEASVQEAVGGFLKFILPAGTEVIEGMDTAVPVPRGRRYVVVTPTSRPRLATNLVLYADTEFFGSIQGNTLTVTTIRFGTVALNSLVWGTHGDVLQGTTVIAQLTGATGGAGTYTVNCASQHAGPETMACGNMSLWTDYELTLQLDVHGNNPRDSTDMAGTISALLRDEVATSYFDSLKVGVSPLHADEPRMAPFQNAEQAWETRWVIDANFMIAQRITLPMQFMTNVIVNIRPVH
jgi:hypothetical protein